jgi:cell division protein FtsW (lipid II flippase)
MRLTCNIDAKGKAIRLTYGIVLVLAAIAMMLFWADGRWSWVISTAIAIAGAFAIFEARAGWCVVRAMGWKTRV